jgi:hypothetical protein
MPVPVFTPTSAERDFLARGGTLTEPKERCKNGHAWHTRDFLQVQTMPLAL